MNHNLCVFHLFVLLSIRLKCLVVTFDLNLNLIKSSQEIDCVFAQAFRVGWMCTGGGKRIKYMTRFSERNWYGIWFITLSAKQFWNSHLWLTRGGNTTIYLERRRSILFLFLAYLFELVYCVLLCITTVKAVWRIPITFFSFSLFLNFFSLFYRFFFFNKVNITYLSGFTVCMGCFWKVLIFLPVKHQEDVLV